MSAKLLRRVIGAVFVSAAALLITAAPPALSATVEVSVGIPAGKLRTVRLRRLPQAGTIAVQVRTDARLRLALVSALELKSRSPQALFRASVERSLAFRVVIPQAGDYYLLLDNRRGRTPVKARVTMKAQRPPVTPPASPPLRQPGDRPGGERASATDAVKV